MAEYIDREAAVKAANEWVSEACMAPVMRVNWLFDKLQKVPVADVAPVVHGRWIKGLSNPYCSECFVECRDETPFCPNCGAKINGG
jgi:hypothetical protein